MTNITIEKLDKMYHPVFQTVQKIRDQLIADKKEIPSLEVMNQAMDSLEKEGVLKTNEDYVLFGAAFYQIMDYHNQQQAIEHIQEAMENTAFLTGFKKGKIHES